MFAKVTAMILKTWLDAERGRATALAAHLGVSLSRVSQMSDDGVPPKYMLAVRDFTGGEVTLESLVQARTAATPVTPTQPAQEAA